MVTWEKVDDVVFPRVVQGCSQARLAFQALLSIADDHFLSQTIHLPTRKQNTLDLCFTNDPHSLINTESLLVPQYISDHNLIRIQTTYTTDISDHFTNTRTSPEIAQFNYVKANKTDLQAKLTLILGTDPTQFDGLTSAEHKSLLTSKVVEAASSLGIPKIVQRPKNVRMPLQRRKLFVKRCKLLKSLAKRSHPEQLLREIEVIDKQLQLSYQTTKLQEESHAISKIKEDPRFFFKYANSKRKSKNRIGPLKTTKNNKPYIEDRPKAMAEILSNQYKSVFTLPKTDKQVLDPHSFFLSPTTPIGPSLLDIDFSVDDISTALSEINPDSSAGPDGWPAYILRHFNAVLAPNLYKLWRKSLDSGDMPDEVNLANISPIFKGGEKCEPADYRPIALTSHVTKVFERVVRKAIVGYLATNRYFNPTQYGFMAGRSTLTQLIQYYTDILILLEEYGSVDAIYLDFAKAFDKCDHGIILHKLKRFGISGKLGIWLHNFITNRQQVVCVMGEVSSKTWVTSGIPQGSVLGPLLFSILLSDIDTGISISKLLSYADDTKIYAGISNPSTESKLQEDLLQIYNWADCNNQVFNDKKFEMIRFSLKPDLCNYLNPHSLPIQYKPVVKDLGIFFSDDGSFDQHINTIVAKARKLCGWALRTFDTRDKLTMLTLLKSLILPAMEYCCPLWSPTDQRSIHKLETIQRSFTKKIHGFQLLSYQRRLHELNLYSLERRRERYIILYIWKSLFGYSPDPGLRYSSIDRHNGIVLGPPKTHKTGAFKKLFERQFLFRGTRLFNSVPSYLRQLTSPEGTPLTPPTYKALLDKYLSEIPDDPETPRAAASNSIIEQRALKKN